MATGKSSNHYHAGNTSDASVLDRCVSNMLLKDGYVDSIRILNQLYGVVSSVVRLPQFKEIQRINNLTNSGIQVFKNIKAILFYHELEAHLVASYRGQKKLVASDTSITSFLDFGVGYLSCHPEVKAIFGFQGFEKSSTLPMLNLQQVLELAQNFFWNKNQMFCGSYISIDWVRIQDLFQRTLCSHFGIEAPIGIFVQFQGLIHHFRKIKRNDLTSLSQQSQRVVSDALVKLKSVLEKSIQNLCGARSDLFEGICYLMKQTGFDVKLFYSQTRELLANEFGFEILEQLLFEKYFPPRQDLSTDPGGIYFTADPTKTIKTFSRCMATLLLLLLKYVKPELTNPESIDDLVRCHLGNNLLDGIPLESIDPTFQNLKAILANNILGLSTERTVDPNVLSRELDLYFSSYIKTFMVADLNNGDNSSDDDDDFEDEVTFTVNKHVEDNEDDEEIQDIIIEFKAMSHASDEDHMKLNETTFLQAWKLCRQKKVKKQRAFLKRLNSINIVVDDNKAVIPERFRYFKLNDILKLGQFTKKEKEFFAVAVNSLHSRAASKTKAVSRKSNLWKSKANLPLPTLWFVDRSAMSSLIGSVVLFNRLITFHHKSIFPSSRGVDETFLSISKEAVNSLVFNEEASSMNRAGKLFDLVSQVESRLIASMDVPAFDCLNKGSFCSYLARSQSQVAEQMIGLCTDTTNSLEHDRSFHDTTILHNSDNARLLEELINIIDGIDPECQSSGLEILYYTEKSLCELLGVQNFMQVSGKSFLQYLLQTLQDNQQSHKLAYLQDRLAGLLQRKDPCLLGAIDGENSLEQIDSKSETISKSIVDCILHGYFRSHNDVKTSQDVYSLIEKCEEHVMERFQSGIQRNQVRKWISETASDVIAANSKYNEIGILTFPIRPADMWDGNGLNYRQEAINLIARVEFGFMCAESCNWKEIFQLKVSPGKKTSFLDFIANEEISIQQLARNRHYFAAVDLDDCIVVAANQPSFDELSDMLTMKKYILFGAHCISALYSLHDLNKFQSNLRYCFVQYETLNKGWLKKMMEICFHVGYAVPLSYQIMVLKLLFHEVSKVCGNRSVADIHHYSLELVSTDKEFERFQSNACHLGLLATEYSPRQLLFHAHEPENNLVGNRGDMNISSLRSSVGDQNKVTRIHKLALNEEVMLPSTSSISQEASLNVDSCRQFINQMLISDFDYDANINRPTVPTANAIKLQNALTHLSSKLYSSNVHFVMELVQNADDNQYAVGCIPSIALRLYQKELLVYNNEQGFTEKNISALCSVGTSTKAGQRGYIGQKGIGFKSVFAVSAEPEIHSNGFHIKFLRDQSMIEPVWIDSTAWSDSLYDSVTGEEYRTCFRLPFDHSSNKLSKLRQDIEDVFDDRLILFLNKLQQMRLDDRCHDREVIHHKLNLSSNWTRVSSKYINRFGIPSMPSECYWFCRSVSFNPLMKRLSTDTTILDSTEVYIAFKFIEVSKDNVDSNNVYDDVRKSEIDWTADYVNDGDEKVVLGSNSGKKILEYDSNCGILPIYAFLPTKTMLFNFIIQADFVLSSSREGILENDDWNLQILSHIPKLFKSIFEEMAVWAQSSLNSTNTARNDCIHMNQLQSLNYDVQIKPADIFTMLPRLHSKMKESDPYYKLIEGIYAELSRIPFIFNITGELTSPNKLFMLRKDSNLSQLHDLYKTLDNELFQCTKRHFIHPSCEIDNELVKLLKIPVFDGKIIISCLTQLYHVKSEMPVDEIEAQQADRQDSGIHTTKRLDSTVAWLLVLSMEYPKDAMVNKIGNAPSRTIVPSAVITNKLHSRTMPSSNPEVLSNQMIDHLKILPLWYIQSKFQTLLEIKTIYVIPSTNAKFSPYSEIIEHFKHQIMQLDEKFLLTADKLMENGNRLLLTFLLRKIPCSPVRPYGFAELNCDLIAQNIIFPAYKEAQSVPLDRHIASAYLVFLFKLYNNDKSNNAIRMLKNVDMMVPVAKIRDKNGKHEWVSSDVQSIRKDRNHMQGNVETVCSDDDLIYDNDIHLGVEFKQSCTNVLMGLPIVTALQQVNWTILDPIASALALDQKVDILTNVEFSMKHDDLKTRFSYHIHEKKLDSWKEFLFDYVGLVDFFGIRKLKVLSTNLTSQSEYKYIAPGLFSFLKHVTRHGVIIENTPQASLIPSPKRVEDSHAALITTDIEDKINIPLWLRYPEDTAMLVKKDVYKFLCSIYKFILTDLSRHEKLVGQPSINSIIEDLNKFCWLPVWISHPLMEYCFLNNPALSQYLESSKSQSLYILTSPRNAVTKDNNSASRDALGKISTSWHLLYIADSLLVPEMHTHVNMFLKLIVETFNMNTMYLKNEDAVDLFLWMSKQQYNLIASTHQMAVIYNGIQLHKNSNLKQIIINNEPFLWFPTDSSRITDVNRGLNDTYVVVGQMYPLSQVVEDDKTGFLQRMLNPSIVHEVNSPNRLSNAIRVINSAYFENDFNIILNFCRRKVCNACQVLEGMHGRRGIAKCLVNDAMFVNQTCLCKESNYTEEFKDLPGLVRKSPSAEDLLSVVGDYCCQYDSILFLQSNDGMHFRHREELVTQIKTIFEAIGKEVWKCFHIDNSLHPYSPSSLKRLIELLQVKSYFPSMPCQLNDDIQRQFICIDTITRDARYLAIDDKSLFDYFKGVLSASSTEDVCKGESDDNSNKVNTCDTYNDDAASLVEDLIHSSPNSCNAFNDHQNSVCRNWQFIDAIPTERSVNNAFFLDLESNGSMDNEGTASMNYLSMYEESRRVFLSKSVEDFQNCCNHISGKTFYAPNSIRPLLRLLHVKILSDYINTDIDIEGIKSASNEKKKFLENLNVMLFAAQEKLKSISGSLYNDVDLMLSEKKAVNLSALLNKLRLEVCSRILRRRTLSADKLGLTMNVSDGKSLTMEDTIPFQFDKAKTELILSSEMVDSDNNKAKQKELTKLIIDLIMSALRLDIAIYKSNQQINEMSEVENFLMKQLNVDNLNMELMRKTMEYEQMIVDIPDDKRWKSSMDISTNQEENKIALPLMCANEALLGYERLRKTSDNDLATRRKQGQMLKSVSTISMEYDKEDEKIRKELQQELTELNISISETVPEAEIGENAENPRHLSSSNVTSRMDGKREYHNFNYHRETKSNGESPVPGVRLPLRESDHSKSLYNHENRIASSTDVNMAMTLNAADSSNEKTGLYRPGVQKHAVTNDIAHINLSSTDWTAVIKGIEQQSTLDISLPHLSEDQKDQEERILHLKSNADDPTISGRIGECIAFAKLQSMYPGLSVKWLNKDEENGLPYDIVVTVEAAAPDGDNDSWTKYCEVKTRLVDNDDASYSATPSQSRKERRDVRQWFISSKEIVEAEKRGDQYFCILISLEKLRATSIDEIRMCVRSIQIVGYEKGLSMALKTRQASLIVQTNLEISMEYAEEDEKIREELQEMDGSLKPDAKKPPSKKIREGILA